MNESILNYLRETYLSSPKQGGILHETLLSWVWEGDSLVFKFKKPLALSYVDQSSLSSRFAFCQKEVALNQRFTQEIYKGVGAFFWDAKSPLGMRFQFTSEYPREAIDVCVVMKRLSSDLSWEHRIQDQQNIPLSEIFSLCQSLQEQFLRSTKCSPWDPFPVWEDNIQLLSQNNSYFNLELYEMARSQIESLRKPIQKRIAQGHWREGHGDLRLDHIYFEDNQLQVLDCVEFSRAFRIVNPWEEISFALLGFLFYEREDLAFLLIRDFFFLHPEPKDLRFLDFFLLQRALIRWKVNSLRSKPSVDHLRRYAAIVSRFLKGAGSLFPRNLRLTLVIGNPGTGKTTVAKEISQQSKFLVLSMDSLRKHSFGIAPFLEGDPGIYTPFRSKWIYRKAFAITKHLLQSGVSVVVDGTFLKESHRRPFLELAKELQVPLQIYVCEESEETIQKRLEQRQKGKSISDLKEFGLWKKMASEWEALSADEASLCESIQFKRSDTV